MDELKIIDTFLSLVSSEGTVGAIAKSALLILGSIAMYFITNKRKQIALESINKNTQTGLIDALKNSKKNNTELNQQTNNDLDQFKKIKRKR